MTSSVASSSSRKGPLPSPVQRLQKVQILVKFPSQPYGTYKPLTFGAAVTVEFFSDSYSSVGADRARPNKLQNFIVNFKL